MSKTLRERSVDALASARVPPELLAEIIEQGGDVEELLDAIPQLRASGRWREKLSVAEDECARRLADKSERARRLRCSQEDSGTACALGCRARRAHDRMAYYTSVLLDALDGSQAVSSRIASAEGVDLGPKGVRADVRNRLSVAIKRSTGRFDYRDIFLFDEPGGGYSIEYERQDPARSVVSDDGAQQERFDTLEEAADYLAQVFFAETGAEFLAWGQEHSLPFKLPLAGRRETDRRTIEIGRTIAAFDAGPRVVFDDGIAGVWTTGWGANAVAFVGKNADDETELTLAPWLEPRRRGIEMVHEAVRWAEGLPTEVTHLEIELIGMVYYPVVGA
jgi:hypothetical protein